LDEFWIRSDFHGADQLFGGNLPDLTSLAYCLTAFLIPSWSWR
jgi:hypothetical protein